MHQLILVFSSPSKGGAIPIDWRCWQLGTLAAATLAPCPVLVLEYCTIKTRTINTSESSRIPPFGHKSMIASPRNKTSPQPSAKTNKKKHYREPYQERQLQRPSARSNSLFRFLQQTIICQSIISSPQFPFLFSRCNWGWLSANRASKTRYFCSCYFWGRNKTKVSTVEL